ncbi:MAG: sulfurtransferase TusA family protein [Bacillus sp. (in: firmicutes)]
MNITKILDAKGLACPMPIVKTKKAMDTLNSNEVLEVVVTDKGALSDIPAWAKSGGHTILNQKEEEGVYYFYIQKNNKISE